MGGVADEREAAFCVDPRGRTVDKIVVEDGFGRGLFDGVRQAVGPAFEAVEEEGLALFGREDFSGGSVEGGPPVNGVRVNREDGAALAGALDFAEDGGIGRRNAGDASERGLAGVAECIGADDEGAHEGMKAVGADEKVTFFDAAVFEVKANSVRQRFDFDGS